MPIGTLMAAARPTMMSVPAMAGPMPPPSMPAAGGRSMKKFSPSRTNLPPPRTISPYSTENSGTAAVKDRMNTSAVSRALMSVRGLRRECSRSMGSGAASGVCWVGITVADTSVRSFQFGRAAQHQGAGDVDGQGDRQQHQRGVHQGADLQIA